jgi:uncharacterized membrane protein YqaE (UPF0057 family)
MDYTIYLQFQKEHKIITKHYNDPIKIKDLFLETFNTNTNLDHLYFIKDKTLINSNDRVINDLDNQKNLLLKEKLINIECYTKIQGGGIGDDILDGLLYVFKPIVNAILAIGEAFMFLIKAIFWLLKFGVWFVAFTFWIFLDLLNPKNLITDFYNSVVLITITLCTIPIQLVISSFTVCINIIGGWMQGFWGWDMSSLTKEDKNSVYFKSYNRTAGQKIYYTQQNTVPFSIILGTILCPPMGVFMDLGTSGWLNIIVCCLLTLLFYLPGLCYALLIIYS